MDRETETKEQQEIDTLIEKLSNSGVEFRKTIAVIILKRLYRLFQAKNKQITKDSYLRDLLSENFNETEWNDLEKIGLRIPGLRRSKVFDYVSTTYLISALVVLAILIIRNFKEAFAIGELFAASGLSFFGIIVMMACSPSIIFLMLFKRRHLPCETINDLIDLIISVNWTDLLSDDKQLFKDLIRQEEEWSRRARSQQEP
jgi:hypothetical protein